MFFKHPLFWKEWKTAKWWSAVMASMFLVMFLSMSHSLSQYHEMLLERSKILTSDPYLLSQDGSILEPVFLRIFSNGFSGLVFFLVPVIVIMSILLFQSDRKESVGMFISSLPFTKEKQFGVKWFVGILAFTIPFLLATLAALLMRQVNMGWISKWYSESGYEILLAYDGAGSILMILAQSYLFVVAFFSVLMLMQSIIANNIAAGVIGGIVVAAPVFILTAGGATLSRLFSIGSFRIYDLEWTCLYYFMVPSRDRALEVTKLGQEEVYINRMISNENYGITLIMLMVVAVIAIYAGLKFYGKNDNSRNGYLLMFPWVGKILVPGVTVCSALLGNNFMNMSTRIQSVPYELITLGISGLVGYLIIRQVIQLSEKHGG